MSDVLNLVDSTSASTNCLSGNVDAGSPGFYIDRECAWLLVYGLGAEGFRFLCNPEDSTLTWSFHSCGLSPVFSYCFLKVWIPTIMERKCLAASDNI